MPRKLAALIATAMAAVLVTGSLTAVALGVRTSPPPPQTAAASSPVSVPPVVPVPPLVPVIASRARYTGPFGPASRGKVVYLTFDDGPDPTWTPRILATLDKYGAKATFF